jgi:hypothetical protein
VLQAEPCLLQRTNARTARACRPTFVSSSDVSSSAVPPKRPAAQAYQRNYWGFPLEFLNRLMKFLIKMEIQKNCDAWVRGTRIQDNTPKK